VEHIGDEACFTVSDNGLGIPRERLATLFDTARFPARRAAALI